MAGRIDFKRYLCVAIFLALFVYVGQVSALNFELKPTKDLVAKNHFDKTLTEINALPKEQHGWHAHVRVEQFKRSLKARLQADGYYQALIRSKIIGQGLSSVAVITVQSKQRCQIEQVIIRSKQGQNIFYEDLQSKLMNKPLIAQKLLSVQRKIKKNLPERMCLSHIHVTHKVTLNKNRDKAKIIFEIDHSLPAKFGLVHYKGLKSIFQRRLDVLQTWRRGQCFSFKKLQENQQALFETGFFSSVMLKHDSEPDRQGEIPITWQVSERPFRTITLGAYYNTLAAMGVLAGWQHDNWRGHGEVLHLYSEFSKIIQQIGFEFHNPYVRYHNHRFDFSGNIARKQFNAFNSTEYELMSTWTKPLGLGWERSFGVGLQQSHLSDAANKSNFTTVLMPVSFRWDKRDDNLNPTKGHFLEMSVAPHITTLPGAKFFSRQEIQARLYIPINRHVIALRSALGVIVGSTRDHLPANHRFYVGGTGSVRGYGYQLLSDLKQGAPQGGKSFINATAEWRFPIKKAIQGAFFWDMGYAHQSLWPARTLFNALGVGLRYHSPWAPIRFDVGFPLNKRHGVDKAWQCYLSIGQAF